MCRGDGVTSRSHRSIKSAQSRPFSFQFFLIRSQKSINRTNSLQLTLFLILKEVVRQIKNIDHEKGRPLIRQHLDARRQ